MHRDRLAELRILVERLHAVAADDAVAHFYHDRVQRLPAQRVQQSLGHGRQVGDAGGGRLTRVEEAQRHRGAVVFHVERVPERRHNRPLREVLDELLSHTRDIARRAKTMTPAELDYAQQRLEWLADEVWRLSTGEASPPE